MTPKPPPTDGPKHSPTPWEMNKSENGANSPRVAVHAFIGEKLKKIGDLSSFTPDDRALIVRAVNAYDGHVELLERSIATMENIMLHLGKDMTEGDQHGRWKFVEEMKSALAKASRGNL